MAKKILKYLGILGIILLFLLAFLFIPENPYLSNYLKKLILPEIYSATGYPATADKIYLHIFPLYAGIKDLRLMDKEGNLIGKIDSIKVYPEISSLITEIPVIKRISIKKPLILMNIERVQSIKEHFKSYSAPGSKGKDIILKNLEISGGEIYWEEKKATGPEIWSIRNIKVKGRIREEIEITLSGEGLIPELKKTIGFRSELSLPVKTLSKGPEEINIKNMEFLSGRSEITLSGRFNLLEESRLNTTVKIFMEDVIEILSLKKAPDDKGILRLKGLLNIESLNSELSEFLSKISLNLEATGELRLENLMEILNVREQLSGGLKFNVRVEGRPTSPVIKGKARLIKGNLFRVELEDLKTEVTFRDKKFLFSQATAELYGGKAFAEAEIPVPVHDYRLYVKADEINDKALLKLIGLEFPISDGTVEGEFVHSGRIFSPAGWFIYRAGKSSKKKELNPLKTLREIKADFLHDGENNIFKFTDFVADSDLLLISMNGLYRLEDKYMEGRYSLKLRQDFESQELRKWISFTSGNIEGEIRGYLPMPVIRGSISLNSPSIKGYKLDLIKGTFSYRGLDFEPLLTGIASGEEHTLTGRIRFEGSREIFDFSHPFFALTLRLKNIRLKPLIQPLSGLKEETRVNGEIRFKGDNLSEEFDIKLRRLNTTLECLLKLKRWKEYEYELYSFIRPVDLELLNSLPIDTGFRLKAKGHGTLPEVHGFINIQSENVKLNGISAGIIKLDGVLEKGYLTVAGSFFDGLLSLKARSYIHSPLNYNVELEFRDASYKTLLQALIKDAPEDIDLGLKGTLRLSGDGQFSSGSLHFEKFIIKGFSHELKNRGPFEIKLIKKRLVLHSLDMLNEAGSVSASGEVNIGEGYNLELKGSTYLWPFKRISRSIKTLKGKVDFGIMLSGKWDTPQLSGDISLKDGTVSIVNLPYQITDVNFLIRFNENRVNIEQFHGRVAGGTVDGKGIAYLRGFRLGRFNMEVNLRNISATVSEDFILSFDSNLYLKGERFLRLITGEVKLRNAFYRKYIEWRSWMLKGAQQMPTQEVSIPTFLDADLNIKITGPLPETSSIILIDNNIANARLKVDLILKGTLKRPLVLGRVETLDGIVYFRNNELKLLSATADFTSPERIDPYFRIRAETFSRGYRINLLVEGYLRKFNLSLSSEPPLDEVDILSLLAVGETGTALKGYGGGIGAAEATSFITGQLQETLEQRARLYTGIDRVQISPYVSKRGEIGPRITVGKKLGEKLSILYSSAVGSEEYDVIKVEYELSKKILLVGEKDERGSMGGDIKFRFQFR